MKLYISGPMTGLPDNNFPAFHKAMKLLWTLEYDVCNPALNGEGEKTHAEYMRQDIRSLAECDGVCVLPGWHRSKGATLEVAVAIGSGMRIYSLVGESLVLIGPEPSAFVLDWRKELDRLCAYAERIEEREAA